MSAAFLCRVPSDTRQSLYRVPDKKYSAKKSLSMYNSLSFICRMSHSAKLSFLGFGECFRHSANRLIPIVRGASPRELLMPIQLRFNVSSRSITEPPLHSYAALIRRLTFSVVRFVPETQTWMFIQSSQCRIHL
jgi:hypothetical protein